MAIGVSEPVAETITNTDNTSYNGTAYTPAANSVQVVFVVATATVAASPTLSGGSGWSTAPALQTSATFNSGVSTIYCFVGVAGASPGSFTPVFDCTGDGATGCSIAVLAFTGASTSTPVAQTKTKDSTTGTNPTIVADSNLNTNNGYAFCAALAANPAGITETSSWTESVDSGHTSPTTGIFVQYRAGGESGATVATTRAGSINHGIILVEIALAGSGNITGTSAQILPKLAQAAAAFQTNDGTAAQTLPKLAQSAAGTVDNDRTATIAQTLPKLAQAAAAFQTNDGAIAQTLPKLAQEAAGTVDSMRTASIEQVLPKLAQEASGTVDNDRTASIAQILPSLTQEAAGTVSLSSITGTIAQTLPALTGAAAASQENSAAIAQTLPALTQAAAATTGSAVDTYGGFQIVIEGAGLKRKKKKAIKRRVVKQIAPDIRPLIEEANANTRIDAYLTKLIEDAAREEQIRLTAEMLARIQEEIRKEQAEQLRALEARLAEEARQAIEAAIAKAEADRIAAIVAAEREKQRRYREDENDVLTAMLMGII